MQKPINLSHDSRDILDIIKQIATNMKDYNSVLKVITNNNNNSELENQSVWDALTLSHGLPGVCMLYGELAQLFPNESWEEMGHFYLSKVVSHIKDLGLITPSLYSGAAGIGLAINCLSPNGENYQSLINNIDSFIKTRVEYFLENKSDEVKMTDYDVIEGLSGITSYLFTRKDELYINNLIQKILRYFINLTKDIEVNGYKVPGWYIAKQYQFTEEEREKYNKGNFNTGLAHGITGPLIILSKALKHGIEVEGQRNAIMRIVKFLTNTSITLDKNVYWQPMIPFEKYIKNEFDEPEFIRDAWCYGTPGIALGLLNAGIALEDQSIIKLSTDIMKSVSNQINGLVSPTMCHGFSGIIQILTCFKDSLNTDLFNEEIKQYKNSVLNCYVNDYLFGFYDYENNGSGEFESIPNIGLLGGSTGVLLTLLKLERGNKTNWINAFLL